MVKKLKVFGHLLGFLWCLPVSVLVWVFMFILVLRGKIEEITIKSNLSIIWDVSNDSWLYSKMHGRGWFGWALGNNVIVNDTVEGYSMSLKHENTHVIQNYIFGIFFLPVYFLLKCFMFLFVWNKHSYVDHPLERWARRAAGQKVNYTREEWPHGPNDRWAWW